jgi:hypothetical protein
MRASPIRELDNAIASSAFRISPKDTAALQGIVAAKSISLEFCSCNQLKAQWVPGRSVVQLALPFLEVLWAAAHAYIVIFDECKRALRRGEEAFAIGETTRTAEAYQLYRELLIAHVAVNSTAWPSKRIRPERFPNAATDGYIANELFLVAVSWLIHHEIAHADLEHSTVSISSKQEEAAADRAATKWVCSDAVQLELHKPALGIATAVLLLIAYELEGRSWQSSTHPPGFERLIVNLDEVQLGEDDDPYAFAFKLIEIHLLQAQLPHDFDRSGAHRDKCVAACMRLREATGGAAAIW